MAGGRPTKMTPERIAKLEEAFVWGCSDSEACVYADINLATLYRYQERNPEFRDRKAVLKTSPLMMAKAIQHKDLLGGSSAIAQKVIDRQAGKKVALTGEGGGPVEIKAVEYVIKDSEDTGS